MPASTSVFHPTKQTAKPPANRTPAMTREVTRSQVTLDDAPLPEQPQGLDAITKTESATALEALRTVQEQRTPPASALCGSRPFLRSCNR